MATEVRKNDATPLLDERAGPAVEHVRTCAHEAVQQDQRSAGPGLTTPQLHAVAAGESITAHIVVDPRPSAPGRRSPAVPGTGQRHQPCAAAAMSLAETGQTWPATALGRVPWIMERDRAARC